MLKRIRYENFGNDGHLMTVREILEYDCHLIPSWVKDLVIQYVDQSDKSGCIANVTTSFRYHSACICIFPEFFSKHKDAQHIILRHELAHLLMSYFYVWVWDELVYKKHEDQFSEHLEYVNEDIVELMEMIPRNGRTKAAIYVDSRRVDTD